MKRIGCVSLTTRAFDFKSSLSLSLSSRTNDTQQQGGVGGEEEGEEEEEEEDIII